ncbi:MAG: hypothetical protein K2I36_00645 [Ureaplasma sp.]|nr:hypothetical protein [Ureaplasma sp.]
MSIIIYLLPSIVNMSYYQVYNNKMVMITANIIIIVLAISIVIQNYKKNQIDGSELIILSKVITRFAIAWIKIITILLVYILVSLGYVIISLFLLINNSFDSVGGIIVGAFFGPLTTMLFWSGITLFCCLIFKSTITLFLFVFGAMGVSTVISNVIDIKIQNPTTLLNQDGFTTNEFCLFENNDLQNFNTFVICYYNGQVLDTNTKINDESLSQLNLQPNTVLEHYWNKAIDQSGIVLSTYFDIWELTNNLFNIHLNGKWYPKSYDVGSITAEMDGYEQRSALFKYFPINYLELNDLPKIEIDNEFYTLKLNNFNSINKKSIQDLATLPIPSLSNNNFSTIAISKDNLKEFARSYFSNQIIKLMKEYSQKLSTLSSFNNLTINDAVGYFSLLSSYILTKMNINVMGMRFNNSFINSVTENIYNFQRYSYLLLNDLINNPNEYQTIIDLDTTKEMINNILLLNATTRRIPLITMNANEFYNLMQNSNLIDNSKIKNYYIDFSLQMQLMNVKNLESLNLIELSSTFNYDILLIVMLTISFSINIIGSSIVMNKDQY